MALESICRRHALGPAPSGFRVFQDIPARKIRSHRQRADSQHGAFQVGSLRLKFIDYEKVSEWRLAMLSQGRRVVATNGCFDILHAGHVKLLESAKSLGDVLIVGINSDASVRALKGDQRPVNHAGDRAAVLAALESVDAVTVFDSIRADGFLKACQPDIWVKGGDYTIETLDPSERSVVQRIVLVPTLEGYSTTEVINRLAAL